MEKIFGHCFHTTADVQMRWFQSRILHRILPTQKYLHMCKINDNPMCNFCNREDQSISHLLVECEFVKVFWEHFQKNIIDKCQHVHNMNIDKEIILFGVKNNFVSDNVMDLLILYAKFFIYKSKLSNTIPTFPAFENFVKYRYNIDKYSAIVNSKIDHFRAKWAPYNFLLEQAM